MARGEEDEGDWLGRVRVCVQTIWVPNSHVSVLILFFFLFSLDSVCACVDGEQTVYINESILGTVRV